MINGSSRELSPEELRAQHIEEVTRALINLGHFYGDKLDTPAREEILEECIAGLLNLDDDFANHLHLSCMLMRLYSRAIIKAPAGSKSKRSMEVIEIIANTTQELIDLHQKGMSQAQTFIEALKKVLGIKDGPSDSQDEVELPGETPSETRDSNKEKH